MGHFPNIFQIINFKTKNFLFIILFLYPVTVNAENVGYFYFPDDQLTDTEQYFYSDIRDGSLDKYDLYDAFLVSSGIVSHDEIRIFREKYTSICHSIDNYLAIIKQNKQENDAKNILKWLHNNLFISYKENTKGIIDLMNYGEYDCLTSSIMYYILCERLNIYVRIIQVPKHVFCQVYDEDFGKWINVETTSHYGYNPGEIEIENMGDRIIETWLPKTDYDESKIVKILPLFSYVLKERYSLNHTFIKNISYTIDDLYIFKKAYFFDMTSHELLHNIKSLLVKFAHKELEDENFEESIKYITEGLENFNNEFVFQQLHVNYYLKKSKSYYIHNDHKNATLLLEKALSKYQNFDTIEKNLIAYINAWGNDYFHEGHFQKAKEIYEYGLKLPVNHKTFHKNLRSSYYNLANEYFTSNEFEVAIEMCKVALEKYPDDYNLNNLYETIVFNCSEIYRSKNNFSKAHYYCELGNIEFPNSKTWTELEDKINRTQKDYYYQLAWHYCYNSKEYERAYEYCIEGLKIHTQSKDIDYAINKIKKECEFWIVE